MMSTNSCISAFTRDCRLKASHLFYCITDWFQLFGPIDSSLVGLFSGIDLINNQLMAPSHKLWAVMTITTSKIVFLQKNRPLYIVRSVVHQNSRHTDFDFAIIAQPFQALNFYNLLYVFAAIVSVAVQCQMYLVSGMGLLNIGYNLLRQYSYDQKGPFQFQPQTCSGFCHAGNIYSLGHKLQHIAIFHYYKKLTQSISEKHLQAYPSDIYIHVITYYIQFLSPRLYILYNIIYTYNICLYVHNIKFSYSQSPYYSRLRPGIWRESNSLSAVP